MEKPVLHTRNIRQQETDDYEPEAETLPPAPQEPEKHASAKIRSFPETGTESADEADTDKDTEEDTGFKFPDLIDIILILLKYRLLIFCVVILFGYMGFQGALNLQNYYKSEATLIPRDNRRNISGFSAFGGLGGYMASQFGLGGQGELDKIELVLRSQVLARHMINKYNLMPVLFPQPDAPREKKQSWLSKLRTPDPESESKLLKKFEPTIENGVQKLRGMTRVSTNIKKRVLTISVEAQNPVVARNLVLYYITELSEMLRQEVMENAGENIRFFNQQLNQTDDHLLREKIYTMLANEIETETFAKAQKHYGFSVIDPPMVSKKRTKPNRIRHIINITFIGCFLAIIMTFSIEFWRRFRKAHPERYNLIVREFKIQKRKASGS